MGQYSQLYVGNYYFSWKNFIPSYLAIIFDENDFFSLDFNPEYGYYENIGYKTSISEAVEKLDNYGFTLQFFSEIIDFFVNGEYVSYLDTVNWRKEKFIGDSSNLMNNKIKIYFNKKSYPIDMSWNRKINEYVLFLKFMISDCSVANID